MHEFLKEIYNDFCTKHGMPKTYPDGESLENTYLSADDVLHAHMYAEINLTQYQQNWLENYSKLWKQTNGGEDI